ncbi:MAG TPA: membrane protein insertase YidC, partial [Alphaproteobacteria bacterium]
MMQQKGDMHPQDIRNFIIFIVLSLVLWTGYDHFILKPRLEQARAAQAALAIQMQKDGPAIAAADEAKRPREVVVGASPRVKIENAAIAGSLSLKGGRIDDLLLKRYYKTLDSRENVVLFSPSGSDYPKYVEFGWVGSDDSLRLPDAFTVWHANDNAPLTPQSPVTLSWDNGQGLHFERTYAVDDDYLFTITQRVRNNTGRNVILYPYALAAEHGLPEDFDAAGRIAHMGPIGYVGGELYEHAYHKMHKDPRQELKS